MTLLHGTSLEAVAEQWDKDRELQQENWCTVQAHGLVRSAVGVPGQRLTDGEHMTGAGKERARVKSLKSSYASCESCEDYKESARTEQRYGYGAML